MFSPSLAVKVTIVESAPPKATFANGTELGAMLSLYNVDFFVILSVTKNSCKRGRYGT